MQVKNVSSEFILLRDSEEFLRRRWSRGQQNLGVTLSPGTNVPTRGFFLDDDYQGFRDEHGILVQNDGESAISGAGFGLSPSHSHSSRSAGSSRRFPTVAINMDTVVITQDLEVWWITSPKWRRFIPLFCFFCLLLVLTHLSVATTLAALGDDLSAIPDPYVCQSVNCLKIRDWMGRSMDTTVPPCDNFYKYMCGNYEEAERDHDDDQGRWTPLHTMWRSSSASFGDEILAQVLRTHEGDRVLKFYKSCIDQRSRRAAGLEPFLNLLDEIEITSPDRDLNYIAAHLSNYTGDFLFFDYWYEKNKAITVIPMKRPLVDLIVNNPGSMTDLTNLFSGMSKAVVKIGTATGYAGALLDGSDAATSVQTICKCIHDIYQNCNPDNPIDPEDKKIFDYNQALIIAEEIGFDGEGKYNFFRPEDSCFLDLHKGQLYTIPSCLRKAGHDDARIKFAYRVFWILRVFLAFANDLDDVSFAKILNPQNRADFHSMLFLDAVAFRHTWIETQCFSSLAANYGFLAFEAFSKDFETKLALERVREYVRREQRILRKWITLGVFDHLSPADQNLLHNLTSPERGLDVMVDEKLYSYSDLESTLRHWEPDTKQYFWNVWKARRLSEDEMTKDWFFLDKFTPWNTKLSGDLLLSVQTIRRTRRTTDDNKDVIYVPLTHLTLPFFQTEFRVLNFAGVGSFVAREVVSLSLDSPYRPPDSGPEPGPECPCVKSSPSVPCSSSYAYYEPNQKCYSAERTNIFSSALAIKLSWEVFRGGDEYRTMVMKDATGWDKVVESTYKTKDPGNGFDVNYHVFVRENGLIVEKEHVETSRLRFADPDLRPHAKWLKGFEKFSQDQMFFMLLTRLHCFYADAKYEESVNSVLQQVKEFEVAWKCSSNSKMVSKTPWF